MTFFGPLEALRQRPLPDLSATVEKRKNYRAWPLDLVHPLNREPLVDLSAYGIEGRNYYNRPDNPPYYEVMPGSIPDLLLRKSAAEKLQGVDRILRAEGLKLHVHDAWRPTLVQAYMHDVWAPAHIKKKHPHLTGAALVAEVEKYWAAPTVSGLSPAPHNTGGALDLTIFTVEHAEPLFMGTIFDDASALANTDAFEREASSFSADEARQNRRLLYWLMREAGFANTPREWWHYSFGDQLWACLSDAETAWYGAVVP